MRKLQFGKRQRARSGCTLFTPRILEMREIEASRAVKYRSGVFPKYRTLDANFRRTPRHGEKKCISRRRNYSDRTALPRRSCQFVVGVEYCILLIANVTRRLLLNVTHQRAPITIYPVQFLSRIKHTLLDPQRLAA